MRRERLTGAAYAVAAYGFWGVVPAYWRLVRWVPSLELVAHRVLWALPVTLLLVAHRGRMRDLGAALRHRGHRTLLLGTALLVAANWLLFVWAIQSGKVLESSLGYFVTPLVMALLGVVVLGERLRRGQVVAIVLATAGVVGLAVALRAVPWIALGLAGTFGLYGLLRKRAGVDALVGLSVETVLLAPLAVGLLAVLAATGRLAFLDRGVPDVLLVAAAGPVTAIPLLWFANAARRLRYVTLGFFQYLSPTGQFLLAVFAYGEPFTRAHATAFGFIWAAVALYSVDAWRAARAAPPPPSPA